MLLCGRGSVYQAALVDLATRIAANTMLVPGKVFNSSAQPFRIVSKPAQSSIAA